MRDPKDQLFGSLKSQALVVADAGIKSVSRIGDCEAPGLIAAAVYAGHRFAREFGKEPVSGDITPFRREVVGLSEDW